MKIMTKSANTRTIVIALIVVPVILYFAGISMRRKSEFKPQFEQCMKDCFAQGYPEADFTWPSFAMDGNCKCK